ncbi:MAG: hypothetical protein WC901_02330 [Candidatus Margulisiibacteriota bacterium]
METLNFDYASRTQEKVVPKIRFSREFFHQAIAHLTEKNDADAFFDFEDKLIDEIVDICKKFPRRLARELVLQVKVVVDEEIPIESHVAPYLKSLRTSVDGAVSSVLRFL